MYSKKKSKYAKNRYKIDEARYFGSNRPTKHRWVQLLQLPNDSRTYRKIVKNRWWYTSSKNHRLKPEKLFRYHK